MNSFFISICEDLLALIETGLVDEDSVLRSLINGRSGDFVCHNQPVDPTQSMIIISSLEGLEEIEALEYITITTPEVVFGYQTQEIDENGNLMWGPYYWVQPPLYEETTDHWVDTGRVDENGYPIWENFPTTETITPEPYETRDEIMVDHAPDEAMRELYNSIYDQTPVVEPDGTIVTPSQFFALPSGFDASYLL